MATANSLVILSRLGLHKNACPSIVRSGSQDTSPKEGSKHANQTEPPGAFGFQSCAPEGDARLPPEVPGGRRDFGRDPQDPHPLSSGRLEGVEQSGAATPGPL